jgi:HlyD family secretion protein
MPSARSVWLVILTIAPVTEGIFHDFIPLRGKVVPHDTIYIDVIDGVRAERVLGFSPERATK